VISFTLTATTPAPDGFRLDDHQAFEPLRPPERQQDSKQPINTPETRATSSAALQYGNLMAQRDRFQHQRSADWGFRATGTAPLVGIAMNAGYRQAFETTNEFVRIKF
jgi:hypothetical protein